MENNRLSIDSSGSEDCKVIDAPGPGANPAAGVLNIDASPESTALPPPATVTVPLNSPPFVRILSE